MSRRFSPLDSSRSSHPDDDCLLALLYAGADADPHLSACAACQTRLEEMRSRRHRLEREAAWSLDPGPVLLMNQRRRIYARLGQTSQPGCTLWNPRWISAAVTTMLLAGGLFVLEKQRHPIVSEDKISDADLALEVSSLSQSVEAMPVAPLQGLFE